MRKIREIIDSRGKGGMDSGMNSSKMKDEIRKSIKKRDSRIQDHFRQINQKARFYIEFQIGFKTQKSIKKREYPKICTHKVSLVIIWES